jgi:antitoxin (DNA-binding transcriptional repressor) of toxin-antitoxin stability system
MTKIELKKASEPLSKYAQKARKNPVIVVKKGKPFAAVVPIRNADEETVSLSTNRKFLAIIERSRSRTKKGRRDFLQRTSPPAWTKKIVRGHFDVLKIIKTPKFERQVLRHLAVG